MNELKLLYAYFILKSALYLEDFGQGLLDILTEHPLIETDGEYEWEIMGQKNE